jgi:hypothetical protein
MLHEVNPMTLERAVTVDRRMLRFIEIRYMPVIPVKERERAQWRDYELPPAHKQQAIVGWLGWLGGAKRRPQSRFTGALPQPPIEPARRVLVLLAGRYNFRQNGDLDEV